MRLCRRGELDKVETFADQSGVRVRSVLVRHLTSMNEVDRLRGCVRAGYGYRAVDSLRRLYQHQTGRTGPLTLNVKAELV